MNLRIAALALMTFGLAACTTFTSSPPLGVAGKPAVFIDREIEGVWVMKSGELGGEPYLEPGFQLAIKGERFAVEVPPPADRGRLIYHHQQSASQPAGLDMISEEGPNQGRVFPAIYRLVNGELEICYDLSGAARPTAFVAAVGSALLRVTYRRK